MAEPPARRDRDETCHWKHVDQADPDIRSAGAKGAPDQPTIDIEQLASVHGLDITIAARRLRVPVRELRASVDALEDAMFDTSSRIIIIDRDICARMRALARAYVETHPAGGFTLAGYLGRFYGDQTIEIFEEITIGAEQLQVTPAERHIIRELRAAGYEIVKPSMGARKIVAPRDRYDMRFGMAYAIAWIRSNHPRREETLAEYMRRLRASADSPESSVALNFWINQTQIKHVLQFANGIVWRKSAWVHTTPADARAIAGIQFEPSPPRTAAPEYP